MDTAHVTVAVLGRSRHECKLSERLSGPHCTYELARNGDDHATARDEVIAVAALTLGDHRRTGLKPQVTNAAGQSRERQPGRCRNTSSCNRRSMSSAGGGAYVTSRPAEPQRGPHHRERDNASYRHERRAQSHGPHDQREGEGAERHRSHLQPLGDAEDPGQERGPGATAVGEHDKLASVLAADAMWDAARGVSPSRAEKLLELNGESLDSDVDVDVIRFCEFRVERPHLIICP